MYNMYQPWDAALDRCFADEEYPERLDLDDSNADTDESPRLEVFNPNQLQFNF